MQMILVILANGRTPGPKILDRGTYDRVNVPLVFGPINVWNIALQPTAGFSPSLCTLVVHVIDIFKP